MYASRRSPTTGSIHELTRMVFELELVPSVGSRDRSCCETNGEELLAVRVLQTHVLHDHIHSQMGQSLDGRSQEVCTTVCIAVYSVTIIVTPLLIINTPHSLHSHLSQDSTSSRKTQHSPSHRLQSSIPQPLPIYSRAHTARRPTPPRRTAPCMYNLPSKIARYREDTGPRLVAGRYTPSGFAVDVERGLGMRGTSITEVPIRERRGGCVYEGRGGGGSATRVWMRVVGVGCYVD